MYIKELDGDAITYTATNGQVALTAISVGGTPLSSLIAFEEFELSKEVGSIVDTPTATPAAGTTFFTCVASGVFNGADATNLQTLQALATSKRLMAIVLDNEGRYWLVGNEKGCILSAGSNQSGTAHSDLSGLSIELTGISGTVRIQVTV